MNNEFTTTAFGEELTVTKCKCAVALELDSPCEWSGPKNETVVVEYMPSWIVSSHEAAGNWGLFPANGAERVRVHADCAKFICDQDGYAHIVA